jgi:DNA-binding response OmpR family regulator
VELHAPGQKKSEGWTLFAREITAPHYDWWAGVADIKVTGKDGIEMAQRHPPEVVLVDIGLPDIDGYEVARRLRQTIGDTVRLIALTGYGQDRDRALSQQAGFDAHVVKPVDPSKLAAAIRHLR